MCFLVSITGAIMRAGDLLGSGTISGTSEDSFGSMLELSWRGSKEVELQNSQADPKVSTFKEVYVMTELI